MNRDCRFPHPFPAAAGLLLGCLILASASVSFAGVDAKVLVNLEAPVPVNCTVRVGYVDYGVPDVPIDRLDFARMPFSMFQELLLVTLAKQDGLLIDIVGAAEAQAFESFLENLRRRELSQLAPADVEFGRREPPESEKYENCDLRALIDEGAWRACDYEISITVSDWDHGNVSQRVNMSDQYWTLDTWIERAKITLSLVDLESEQTVFSVFYSVFGDDMNEEFGEVATDFAALFEIALWRQWIEGNLKSVPGGQGN